jgi:hypothetical protein
MLHHLPQKSCGRGGRKHEKKVNDDQPTRPAIQLASHEPASLGEDGILNKSPSSAFLKARFPITYWAVGVAVAGFGTPQGLTHSLPYRRDRNTCLARTHLATFQSSISQEIIHHNIEPVLPVVLPMEILPSPLNSAFPASRSGRERGDRFQVLFFFLLIFFLLQPP